MLSILNNMQQFIINVVIALMIISVFLIVIQRNPVFAVFGFVLTALLTFTFLLLIGAEFFALLIVIIYTVVITVLFLFTVITIFCNHTFHFECLSQWADNTFVI